jgi:hypothetical protein
VRIRLTAILVAISCSGTHRAPVVASNGVELRRIEPSTARPGAMPDLAPGDFVLSARGMRVAIAGVGHPASASARPGSVMHARREGLVDPGATQAVLPVVWCDGRPLALQNERFEITLDRDRPTLQMSAIATTPAGALLSITRDFWLEPGRDALSIDTRVEHVTGPPARGVSIGARLPWRAQAPFAPGLGIVHDPTHARAPWVGRNAGGAVFAWTTLADDLSLEFEPDMHHNAMVSGETIAADPPHDLVGPHHAVGSHALLFLVPGDLADAARSIARARGVHVNEVPFVLHARDPVDDAFATVTRSDGLPLLIAALRVDEVRTLPLPDGEFSAYAAASGHTPADPVTFVARERREPVAITLPPGGTIRFEAQDAATGRALPVRVVIRGTGTTPDPILGPVNAADGAGTIVVAPSGRGEVQVPPGDYSVTVSHGPEWSIARANVSVTTDLRGDVSLSLSHVIPMPDWTACDLHVHSHASFDSEVSVQDRVASLVVEGVEFATPTEHNVVGTYARGVSALPAAAMRRDVTVDSDAGHALVTATTGGLVWVPAVEVTTDHAASPVGHFNIYPYQPDPAAEDGAPPPYTAAPREIFRIARANNAAAIIQVNHPRMRPAIGYFDQVGLDTTTNTARSQLYDPGYDAIEVFNGYYISSLPDVDHLLRDWMALLGTGARYIATASSDSHTIAYHTAGYPRTYVYTPGAGDVSPAPEVVLAGLHAGHVFGTSGPMLLVHSGDALPGDTVRLAPDATEAQIDVRLMAASWIDVKQVEIYRDGQRVTTLPVTPASTALRLERTVTVPIVAPRSFVVVVARGDETMDAVLPTLHALPLAFANPIWFEHTGDAGR